MTAIGATNAAAAATCTAGTYFPVTASAPIRRRGVDSLPLTFRAGLLLLLALCCRRLLPWRLMLGACIQHQVLDQLAAVHSIGISFQLPGKQCTLVTSLRYLVQLQPCGIELGSGTSELVLAR